MQCWGIPLMAICSSAGVEGPQLCQCNFAILTCPLLQFRCKTSIHGHLFFNKHGCLGVLGTVVRATSPGSTLTQFSVLTTQLDFYSRNFCLQYSAHGRVWQTDMRKQLSCFQHGRKCCRDDCRYQMSKLHTSKASFSVWELKIGLGTVSMRPSPRLSTGEFDFAKRRDNFDTQRCQLFPSTSLHCKSVAQIFYNICCLTGCFLGMMCLLGRAERYNR